MALVVLTGGARSGKSSLAVRLARAHAGEVVLIATARESDAEMAARIARHRAERPAGWSTVEEPVALARALLAAPAEACVVVDCLALWLANLLERGSDPAAADDLARGAALVAARRTAPTIVVTNEVGSGTVPMHPLGRAFRDALGRANAAFAEQADEAYLVVAGRVVRLERPGSIGGLRAGTS